MQQQSPIKSFFYDLFKIACFLRYQVNTGCLYQKTSAQFTGNYCFEKLRNVL